MKFKFNTKFLLNLTFYNSLGLLAVYLILDKIIQGIPETGIYSLLLKLGAAATAIFLVKRIFFSGEEER